MLRRLRIENLVLIRTADLRFGPGLTAITGETGAGKTIFAQAIGLLLGAKVDATAVGPAGTEAYVEAELDVPDGFWEDEELATLAELRPEDEDRLVLGRRVSADGRTRAFAWGRAVPRDEMVGAMERLIAISGQFEQRRLARPRFQLDTLDAHLGPGQRDSRVAGRSAWLALGNARRALQALEDDAGAAAARLAELEALTADTRDLVRGEEDLLRAERERTRHVGALLEGAAAAVTALDPDDGEGAATLAAVAHRSIEPLGRFAPELATLATDLQEIALRLREATREARAFLTSLDVDPTRVEQVEARLDGIAAVRRRYGASTLDALLDRRDAAATELDERAGGRDPLEAARSTVSDAETRYQAVADQLSAIRVAGAPAFAAAVAAELGELGMGDGEFVVEVRAGAAGPTGADDVVFHVRPNRGLALAPVAETASGGELSRIALAIATVAGGETLVLDEIDAGIGGVTAHGVARVLQRLAERAQVLTITHLPQIASVAHDHLRIEKVPGDPTTTRIDSLDGEGRREELERMLGGGAFVAAVTDRP